MDKFFPSCNVKVASTQSCTKPQLSILINTLDNYGNYEEINDMKPIIMESILDRLFRVAKETHQYERQSS